MVPSIVTEYRDPHGLSVAWYRERGRNGYPVAGWAILSPIGGWLIGGTMGDNIYRHREPLQWVSSIRWARMCTLGGNGRLLGRHAEPCVMRTMTRVHVQALMTTR
jgi:hypothetical protein